MTSQAWFGSRRVFNDSSAYYALAAPDDDNHAAATVILNRLIAERRPSFTTNFVVAETHALVLNRRNRQLALRVLSQIDRSSTVIVRVSAADERRAREILAHYADKDFTLTDATSFAVMDRLRIPVAFTFDGDFAQYRFRLLSAEEQRG